MLWRFFANLQSVFRWPDYWYIGNYNRSRSCSNNVVESGGYDDNDIK
jgi:hypothetical protein